MNDPRAGLTVEQGRRFFRPRRVHFQTIDVTAEDLHGKWLSFQEELAVLDWARNPGWREIRDFAFESSRRFIAFFYQVFEVVLARALARRDTAVLRYPLFVSRAFFDTGVPEEPGHASVPPALQEKILREYRMSLAIESPYRIHYPGEYLASLTDDLRPRLARFHRLWELKDARSAQAAALSSLPEDRDVEAARSVVFHASRCHRVRLRIMHMRAHKRSTNTLATELQRALGDFEQRRKIFQAFENSAAAPVVDGFLEAQRQIESLYTTIDPFEERQAVKEACLEILARLRPLRRTAAAYSLIPGEKHGAMSLNPVIRLWKDKPEPPDRDAEILSLEMNTKLSIECLFDLAMLADPGLKERSVHRGRIALSMRGREDLGNLHTFLLPGSCAPLREIHPLDFPEFRSRVIGESRSPGELGSTENCVLTGAWYSRRQHTMYVTAGADNGRLLKLLWYSQRSPGPPAFFFAVGQFVHDCLKDDLVYRRSAGIPFRECVEDYYDFEDRIRKNRGEKTGRRRVDNSRAGVRFMFAVLYSRMITEILTGSYQSQFRHAATEKWMEANLGLSRDREKLRKIRLGLRAIVQERSSRLTEKNSTAVSGGAPGLTSGR